MRLTFEAIVNAQLNPLPANRDTRKGPSLAPRAGEPSEEQPLNLNESEGVSPVWDAGFGATDALRHVDVAVRTVAAAVAAARPCLQKHLRFAHGYKPESFAR
jgi:hypothetical protein